MHPNWSLLIGRLLTFQEAAEEFEIINGHRGAVIHQDNPIRVASIHGRLPKRTFAGNQRPTATRDVALNGIPLRMFALQDDINGCGHNFLRGVCMC